MSASSDELRGKDAKRLRHSRNPEMTDEQRATILHEARGYKALAHNEEWLQGQPQKSRKREQK